MATSSDLTNTQYVDATIDEENANTTDDDTNLLLQVEKTLDKVSNVASTRGKRGRKPGAGRGGKATNPTNNLDPTLLAFITEIRMDVKNTMVQLQDLNSSVTTAIARLDKLEQENKDLNSKVTTVIARLDQLEQENRNLHSKINTASTRIDQLQQENQVLRQTVNDKDRKIEDLNTRAANLEFKEPSDKLVITSPSITAMNEDNLKNEAVQLISANLKIAPTKLSTFAYMRAGKQKDKIIVSSVKGDDRAAFFTASRTIRPQNFYVNEFLTREQSKLFYDIRQYRKNNNLEFIVYTFKGDVYVKKQVTDSPKPVRSVSEVNFYLS